MTDPRRHKSAHERFEPHGGVLTVTDPDLDGSMKRLVLRAQEQGARTPEKVACLRSLINHAEALITNLEHRA